MKLHKKGFWFNPVGENNKAVTKSVTRKEGEGMKTLGDKIRSAKAKERAKDLDDRTKLVEKVTRDVTLRLGADNDLLMFLDRDRDNIGRYNALRGLMLEFMGSVARDAWNALDKDNAKKVYRMYDHMSTGIQKAERVLMQYMIETIEISNDLR